MPSPPFGWAVSVQTSDFRHAPQQPGRALQAYLRRQGETDAIGGTTRYFRDLPQASAAVARLSTHQVA